MFSFWDVWAPAAAAYNLFFIPLSISQLSTSILKISQINPRNNI